ncbi:MAG: hypothetical protein ACOYM8_13415 [Caulobacterales bacterium]
MMADIQKELALRLAWYIDRYGAIPERDMIKLAAAVTCGREDDETGRITALAGEILEYLRSLD